MKRPLIAFLILLAPALSQAKPAQTPSVPAFSGKLTSDQGAPVPFDFRSAELLISLTDNCEEGNLNGVGFARVQVESTGQYHVPEIAIKGAVCGGLAFSATLVDKSTKKDYAVTSFEIGLNEGSKIPAALAEIRYTMVRNPTTILFTWDTDPKLSKYITQYVFNGNPVEWTGTEWKQYIVRNASRWILSGSYSMPGHYGAQPHPVTFSTDCAGKCLIESGNGNVTQLSVNIPADYDFASTDRLAKGLVTKAQLKSTDLVDVWIRIIGSESLRGKVSGPLDITAGILRSVSFSDQSDNGGVNVVQANLEPGRSGFFPGAHVTSHLNF